MHKAHRPVFSGIFQSRHIRQGIPCLLKCLCLIRSHKREIGLIIRVAASHDFQIGPVLIRQVRMPYIPEFPASPREEFLSYGYMMVRHMYRSPFSSVVIAAHKIIIRIQDEKGRRRRNILKPGDIRPFPEIRSGKFPSDHRERRDRILIMISNVVHIRRELQLVILVGMNRQIGPPVKGLHGVCRIIQPCFHRHIGFAGPDSHPNHALHAE